jgi:hypothetical protein
LHEENPQNWTTFSIIRTFESLTLQWLAAFFSLAQDCPQRKCWFLYMALLFWNFSVIRYAPARPFSIKFPHVCAMLLFCFVHVEIYSVCTYIHTTDLEEAVTGHWPTALHEVSSYPLMCIMNFLTGQWFLWLVLGKTALTHEMLMEFHPLK